jgi:hypothetical protein
MEGDIQQPGNPDRPLLHVGPARYRLRVEYPVTDNAKSPGPLGDQDVAVRKERHAPGVSQALGNDHDANVRLLERAENDGFVGERHRRHAAKLGGLYGVHTHQIRCEDRQVRAPHARTTDAKPVAGTEAGVAEQRLEIAEVRVGLEPHVREVREPAQRADVRDRIIDEAYGRQARQFAHWADVGDRVGREVQTR